MVEPPTPSESKPLNETQPHYADQSEYAPDWPLTAEQKRIRDARRAAQQTGDPVPPAYGVTAR